MEQLGADAAARHPTCIEPALGIGHSWNAGPVGVRGRLQYGPARDPREWTMRRFERYLGPGTPRYTVQRAIIRITADNGYIVYVNGKKVGATFDDVYRRFLPSADWRQFQTYDVTDAIVEHSSNVIMVDVYDYGVAAAFLLDGEIWCRSGASCSAQ